LKNRIRVVQFADTHLGKQLYNHSREAETEDILNEIVEISKDKKCDFFVHGGDVYDVFSPPSWAVKLFNGFLRKLAIPGVVVSGNHDSRTKLEESSDLYDLLGIKLVTGHSTTKNVFTLENNGKSINFGAIPWVSSSSIIDFSENNTSERKIKYSETVKKYALELCKNLSKKENGPKFLATHAMIDSAIADGSEKALTIMDTYTVPKTIFSKDIDYAAIGHIHRGQEIDGAPCPAVYSGSTRAETFGDKSGRKHIVIVDFIYDGSNWIYSEYEKVELKSPKKLINLSVEKTTDFSKIKMGNPERELIKLRAPSDMRFDFDLRAFIKSNKNIIHVEYSAILQRHKILEVDQKKVSSPDGMLDVYLNYVDNVKKQELSKEYKDTVTEIFNDFQHSLTSSPP